MIRTALTSLRRLLDDLPWHRAARRRALRNRLRDVMRHTWRERAVDAARRLAERP